MMAKNELVEYFKKEICPYCTGNCDRGISFTIDGAKCVDYEKKDTAKKKHKNIYVTADRDKPLMRGII